MNNISVTLNTSEIQLVKQKIGIHELPSSNGLVMHLYKYNGCTITLYQTKVLLIQGNQAAQVYEEIFEKPFQEVDAGSNSQTISPENKSVNQNYIATMGADEVGVGDFFGGITVASAFVSKDQIAWLKEIGVRDSKALSDEKIMRIYEEIKDKIPHIVKNITAIEYNAMYEQYQNSHIIKAVLHNQALWDLSNNVKRPYFVIMDQFAEKEVYSTYLRKARKTEFTIDIFETKAESKYMAVACASIIARVHFLQQIDQLSNKLKQKVILGSSNPNIKALATNIMETSGVKALADACKNHFITFREIVEG